jgi:MFS family permease
LAEFYNPRKVILAGLGISLVGSIISMSAVNFEMYLTGRSLEGLGLGCISPLTRALLVDIFERKEFAGRAALISIATAVLPAVSSLAGGHIMAWIDWRAIFGFLVLLNLLAILFTLKYIRSFPTPEKPSGKSAITYVFESYLTVLKSRYFWGYISPYAIFMGLLIGYYSATPFWFVNEFGYSGKQFSNLLLPTAASITFGLFLARKLINKWPIDRVILWGLLLSLCTFVVTLTLWAGGIYGGWAVGGIFSLLGMAEGIISPGTNAECLTRLKAVVAPASALITSFVFVMSSLFSYITMKMDVRDFYTLVVLVGTVVITGFLIYWFGIYSRLKK